jgi:hypothetical protein
LVVQTQSIDAAHESLERPSVEQLFAVYEIDETLAQPTPHAIGVVDDVMTAGTHFVAAASH